MSRNEEQQKIMEAVADVITESNLTNAEVIGILSLLQTTYVIATTGVNK
jgi:hypothetical protein